MLTSRSRSGSGYGSALTNTGLVKLKIRMLRPMPQASDARAMAVNPGVVAKTPQGESELMCHRRVRVLTRREYAWKAPVLQSGVP